MKSTCHMKTNSTKWKRWLKHKLVKYQSHKGIWKHKGHLALTYIFLSHLMRKGIFALELFQCNIVEPWMRRSMVLAFAQNSFVMWMNFLNYFMLFHMRIWRKFVSNLRMEFSYNSLFHISYVIYVIWVVKSEWYK